MPSGTAAERVARALALLEGPHPTIDDLVAAARLVGDDAELSRLVVDALQARRHCIAVEAGFARQPGVA